MKRLQVPFLALLSFLLSAAPAEAENRVASYWEKESAAIEASIVAERWRDVERRAISLGKNLMDTVKENSAAPRAFAQVSAWRALALLGMGKQVEAEWFWYSALALSRDIEKLSEGGNSRWAPFRALRPTVGRPFEGPDDPRITPPEVTHRGIPLFPHNRHPDGTVVIGAYLGADGLLREPEVLPGSPTSAAMRYSALDALVRWRFKPAKVDGEAVEVLHEITVNYKWRG